MFLALKNSELEKLISNSLIFFTTFSAASQFASLILLI